VLQSDEFHFVTIREDETVRTAILRLGEKKITSLPVLSNAGKCVGAVDMLDLLTFASAKLGFKAPTVSSSHRAIQEYLSQPVRDLVNISGRNRFVRLAVSAGIQDLFEVLAQPDVHRVALRDDSKKIVGLVTQSRLVRYIKENQGDFSSKWEMRVKDFCRMGNVATVNVNQFVIDAIRRLEESRISGIAVVDDEGKLVGNISASDLKRMQVDSVEQLCYDIYQHIHIFLNLSTSENIRKQLPHFEPFTVSPEDTLGKVIDLVVEKGIHRVYICDSDRKPVGEISLCDILAQFKGTQSD
jgi:CBS domain-containing protein